jgi:hypothetical protein
MPVNSNDIRRAFGQIAAEEKLKATTSAFLKRQGFEKARKPARGLIAGLACAATFAIVGFFSYNAYFTEAAYVDIDVNPSIELVLNRFDRVIAADAYNEDGRATLSDISVRNKTYEDALRAIVADMDAKGYLRDTGLFTVTLQTDSGSRDKLLGNLKNCVASLLQGGPVNIEQDVFAVDDATKTTSHDLHLSPAKYLAIQDLQTVNPSVSIEDCRDHTISDIRNQTRMHQGHGDTGNSYGSEHSGSGSGEGAQGNAPICQNNGKQDSQDRSHGHGKGAHHE